MTRPRQFLHVAAALSVALGAAVGSQAATTTVSNVTQLNSAMGSYNSGDTIVLNPGTYNLTSRMTFNRGAVTFRGATSNRDDVVLVGPGMTTNSEPRECLDLYSDDVTIRNLTVKEFYWHGVHLRAENDVDRLTLSNVRIVNCGERYIKGSYNSGAPSNVSDNCLIENVLMEQTKPMSGHTDNDYIGGIDVMGQNNLIVRDVTAKNIQGATGGGRGGIFLWNAVTNPTVERCKVIGCDRGIALGNPSGTTILVSGGIVRDNFIARGSGIGLELCFTSNVKVYNNTLYGSDASYSRAVHLYGASTVNLQSKYNIIRGQVFANGTNWTDTGSIIGATAADDWFFNAAAGDLHLTELATAAIAHGAALPDVPSDFDQEGLYGNTRDVGADEFRLRGDANCDLDVDFGDYQVLEVNFGRTGKTWTQGDFDYDGDVDFADYQALEGHFGQALSPANVPEPGTLALAVLGLTGLLTRRRR